jgi:hypothetical protein
MPVAFEPRSPDPTTELFALGCNVGPDLISLLEEPVAVEEEVVGVPDALTVLSDTPTSVDTAVLTEPARRLLVLAEVATTTLD